MSGFSGPSETAGGLMPVCPGAYQTTPIQNLLNTSTQCIQQEQNSSDTNTPQQSPAASFIACVPISLNGAAQEENAEASLMLPFPPLFFAKRKQENLKCGSYTHANSFTICLES